MYFLFLTFLHSDNMTDTYDKPLAQLQAGEITHQQFLTDVGCEEQFKNWCKDHHVKEDEGAAALYYDYYGFEESSIVKEFIEPVG